MNVIAKIFASLGINLGDVKGRKGEPRLQPSSTKRGPGRRHVQGDGSRTSEQLQAGSYGRGLRNHINRANALRLQAKASRKAARLAGGAS